MNRPPSTSLIKTAFRYERGHSHALPSIGRPLGFRTDLEDLVRGAGRVGGSSRGRQRRPPDRKALRDTLKQLWDSLESVAYREEDHNLDDKGKLNDDLGYTRYDVVLASGGRRAITVTAVRPKGEEIIGRNREDGRLSYGFTPSPGGGDRVDRLVISNQENTAESWSGTMWMSMWILTPGGKPVYAYLDSGAKVAASSDPEHPDRVTLTANFRGNEFQCELDPDHDWLPVKIAIAGGFTVIEVEEFTRDHGRWFPLSGVNATTVDGKTTRTAFRVDQPRINRPLADDTFARPTPIPGAFVNDKTINKGEIVGGLSALKKLQEEDAARASKVAVTTRIATASRDPEPSPWPWILGGGMF